MRQVLVYRGEDGLWVAECPSLPGCVSQGETQESAIDNITEAIAAYVGEADHLPEKSSSTHAQLRCEPSKRQPCP
jgi:predicted RNase H-like HicB family nuclease